MSVNRISLARLIMLLGAVALFAAACSQPAPALAPAPAGPSADEIRAIVQEAVESAPAPAAAARRPVG